MRNKTETKSSAGICRYVSPDVWYCYMGRYIAVLAFQQESGSGLKKNWNIQGRNKSTVPEEEKNATRFRERWKANRKAYWTSRSCGTCHRTTAKKDSPRHSPGGNMGQLSLSAFIRQRCSQEMDAFGINLGIQIQVWELSGEPNLHRTWSSGRLLGSSFSSSLPLQIGLWLLLSRTLSLLSSRLPMYT